MNAPSPEEPPRNGFQILLKTMGPIPVALLAVFFLCVVVAMAVDISRKVGAAPTTQTGDGDQWGDFATEILGDQAGIVDRTINPARREITYTLLGNSQWTTKEYERYRDVLTEMVARSADRHLERDVTVVFRNVHGTQLARRTAGRGR